MQIQISEWYIWIHLKVRITSGDVKILKDHKLKKFLKGIKGKVKIFIGIKSKFNPT